MAFTAVPEFKPQREGMERLAELDSDTRFFRRLLIVILVALLMLALWQVLHVLMLILGAVLLAVLLTALARPLKRWLRVSGSWALALSVAIVITLIGGGIWLFGSEISAQVAALIEAMPKSWQAVENRMSQSSLGREFMSRLGGELLSLARVIGDVSRVVLSISSAITDMFIMVVGGIYFAAQPALYRDGLLALLPRSRRSLALETLTEMGIALRRWLVARLIAMIIIGLLTTVGLSIIGVPSALALGLFAGLAEFIPLVGPIIAAVPILLVAVGQSPEMALWALALIVAVQQLESNIITPLLQQHAIALPPALSLFAVIAAGFLFGAIGVLFAGPLTVIVFVALKLLYVRETLGNDADVPTQGSKGEKGAL